jgi:NADH-quinone oxidoreductase subunit C
MNDPEETKDEKEQRREEALARGAERRRQREGATAKEYPPSPLGEVIQKALQHLPINIEQIMDEIVIRTNPEFLIETCKLLKETEKLEFNYLRCLSAVDYVEKIETVYHLSSLQHPYKTVVKTQVSSENVKLPSVIQIWRGADWHEREAHDLFGIVFTDHPNMAPLLLFDGFEGFPLRKSYKIPEQKEGLGG